SSDSGGWAGPCEFMASSGPFAASRLNARDAWIGSAQCREGAPPDGGSVRRCRQVSVGRPHSHEPIWVMSYVARTTAQEITNWPQWAQDKTRKFSAELPSNADGNFAN